MNENLKSKILEYFSNEEIHVRFKENLLQLLFYLNCDMVFINKLADLIREKFDINILEKIDKH